MRVYLTNHVCHSNTVRSDRYWIADETKSKLTHIGVCDVDSSFISMLITSLGADLIILDMPDDAFKKLMISEGYSQ